MTEIIGSVGIIGIVIAVVLTKKIGDVLFRNAIGTLRGWAGAYFVLFLFVILAVYFVFGKVIGTGHNGNRVSNRADDYSDESYSDYSDEYTYDHSDYFEYADSNSYDESYDEGYYDNDDEWSAEDEYILPYSDYQYLEEWQLKDLSKEELRIARNEIFARHGRTFNDKSLMAYFESKSWYYPSYDPDEFDSQMENILNDVEKENVQLIKKEESKR